MKTIVKVASIVAILVAGILLIINISQLLQGSNTVQDAQFVVYDITDTAGIAAVRGAAWLHLICQCLGELTLLAVGICGLKFAGNKGWLIAGLSGATLVLWIGDIFAWDNLDKIMNEYDVYSNRQGDFMFLGGIIFIISVICIIFIIGAIKNKKVKNEHFTSN